jgi:hypothetical protein
VTLYQLSYARNTGYRTFESHTIKRQR